MTFTPQEQQANRRIWANVLETVAYRQGTGQLRADPDCHQDEACSGPLHCCLGVLMELAMLAGLPITWKQHRQAYAVPDDTETPQVSTLHLSGPPTGPMFCDIGVPKIVQDWVGLASADGGYYPGPEMREADRVSLANRNDNGATFHDIAATIREEPHGLFTTPTPREEAPQCQSSPGDPAAR